MQAKVHDTMVNEENRKKLKDSLSDPEVGGEADLLFPKKLKARPLETINWWESLAQWDLASQRSLAWHAKAQILLGILTVLAMAIYLFAQAHSLEEGFGGRRLMGYGLALVGNSVLCFIMILLVIYQESDRAKLSHEAEAAKAYGAAMQKDLTARRGPEFQKVVDDLNKAIEANPKLARARLSLAYALQDLRSSQAGEFYISLPGKDTLTESIGHLKTAIQAMLANGYAAPAALLSFLGCDTLMLAFDKNDLAGVREALTYFQKAEAQGIHGGNKTTMAMIHWNLATTRLAAGESQEIDPKAFRLLNEAGDANLIISSFTDLEVLEKYYPYLHGGTNCQAAVEQAKQRLIEAFVRQDWERGAVESPIPVCGDLLPKEPEIMVSPQTVEWRGHLPQLQKDQDKLCLIWYIKDADWGVWRALPTVSGPVNPKELSPDKTIPESWFIRRSYLAESAFRSCLLPGTYKAELYLNGRLFSSPCDVENLPEDFAPQRLLHLNVGLCCPKDWKLYTFPKQMGDNEFIGRIFANSKQRPTACVFTFYASRAVQDPKDPPAVKWARQILSQKPLNLPDNWALAPYNPEACAAPPPGVAGLYKQWVTPDGVHHVGVVFIGTAPFCDLCNTLASMDNLYKVDIR